MGTIKDLFALMCPDIELESLSLNKEDLSASLTEEGLKSFLKCYESNSAIKIFSARCEGLFFKSKSLNFSTNLAIAKWNRAARDMFPNINDWTGIYLKASFALDEESTDLVLGPFIGAPTNHTRIPIDKGLCGLALKEEATINIGDVKSDERYLACSLETEAEIVIPLAGPDGEFVAELDIDAHTKNAFDDEKEAQLKSFCETFKNIF